MRRAGPARPGRRAAVPFGDLSRQYRKLRRPVDAAIRSVLSRGWFILGERVSAFERAFAAYCGARHAVGVASGTDAIELALRAAGVGPGDEVVTVPNTAVPTVCAIVNAGARPVFVDVRADTYVLDPDLLAAAVTSKTRAIVPVHLYGQPADMDAINRIAGRHGLRVIEDAAQAHGSRYRGRRVGALGNAGCFSFYPTKNLGAFGDGGMVVTNDAELARGVALLRNYGQTDRYRHAVNGVNSRLDELQAAVLLAKLPRLETWNRRRRRIAALYARGLRGTGVVVPAAAPHAEHVYHLFVVRTRHRDRVRDALAARGIGTQVHYPIPIHLQEAYRGLGLPAGSFPVAESLAAEILSLPMFPELSDDEVRRVCLAVRECLAAMPERA